MKIDLRDVRDGEFSVTEQMKIETFPADAHYSLKAIGAFSLTATLTPELETVGVTLNAEIPVTLECAYTLKHFASVVTLDEYLCFTTTYTPEALEELDDCYYERGPLVDLTPYVFILLVSSIPLRVIAPGAKIPQEALTEEEYLARQTNKPFASDSALDELYDKLDD